MDSEGAVLKPTAKPQYLPLEVLQSPPSEVHAPACLRGLEPLGTEKSSESSFLIIKLALILVACRLAQIVNCKPTVIAFVEKEHIASKEGGSAWMTSSIRS